MGRARGSVAAALGLSALVVPASVSAEERPGRAPGEYIHDGFFLRLALGVTVMRDSYDAHGDGILFGDSKGTVTGFGQAHEIAVGGSVAPGLSISGVTVVDIARTTSADYEGDAVDPDEGYVFFTFAPMVTYYPNAEGGFHVSAGGGLAISSGVQPEGVDGGSGTGFGMFASTGYDWWIAKQWAMGPSFRVHYISTEESASAIFDTLEVAHRGVALTLLLAATHN